MIKQCLDCAVSPIVVDSEFSKEYKASLYKAQATGNMEDFLEILRECQERFSRKEIVIDTLESMTDMDV